MNESPEKDLKINQYDRRPFVQTRVKKRKGQDNERHRVLRVQQKGEERIEVAIANLGCAINCISMKNPRKKLKCEVNWKVNRWQVTEKQKKRGNGGTTRRKSHFYGTSPLKKRGKWRAEASYGCIRAYWDDPAWNWWRTVASRKDTGRAQPGQCSKYSSRSLQRRFSLKPTF